MQPTTLIEPEIKKENIIDLNQFETIPALDRAIAEPEGKLYTNYDDFRKDLYKD